MKTLLFLLLTTPVYAHAPSQCDQGALARAEAGLNTAQRRQVECWGPSHGCAVLDALVESAVAQLDAARALCDIEAPHVPTWHMDDADPWSATPLPMSAQDQLDMRRAEDGAMCAVMNDCDGTADDAAVPLEWLGNRPTSEEKRR